MKHSITLFSTLLLSLGLLSSAHGAASEGLKALFPDGITDKEGQAVSTDTLEGKVVGIYFSAHWCGPCRAFTPNLVKYHAANKADFDVVFVSSDRSEEDQFKYMEEAGMTWSTVKYKSAAANALKKKFGVRGIPKLVMVDREGNTLSGDGRGLVGKNVPAAKLASAKIVKEEYLCGKCDKTHTRDKLVFADDEQK